MKIKKVVVAGGGVLGTQIAFQAAYCGFDVTIWLRSESSFGRTRPKLENVYNEYQKAVKDMVNETGPWCRGIADEDKPIDWRGCNEAIENAHKRIVLELDMKEAFGDADLVIESMAENVDDKIAFYKKLAPVLPEKAILVTNSSTLLPSTFAKYTGRPEKYLSLHFANYIWRNNTAEVMGHPKTSQEAFEAVIKFANDIRMVALPVLKEKNGYLLNSMLVPFLFSGLDLYAAGVSDPESIDKAWKLGTGAPRGPFEIFDVVGITTAYNIALQYQKVPGFLSPILKKMMMPYNFKAMVALLKKMLDEGKLGRASGEGFYKY